MMTSSKWSVWLFTLAISLTSVPTSHSSDENGNLREEFGIRRASVIGQTGSRSVVLLLSGLPRVYSNDVNYPFRQENNLFYLTGINQSGTALLMTSEDIGGETSLFLPRRDPSRETWTGHMLSAQEATGISGIDHVLPTDSLEVYLGAVLGKSGVEESPLDSMNIWLLPDSGALNGRIVLGGADPTDSLMTQWPGVRINDVSPIFRQSRLVKSEYELSQIRKAVEITCTAHREVLVAVQSGTYEYELEGLIHATYRNANAQWGFPSIIGSGPNATTLHYEANNRQMTAGELVLLDIGAEVGHYSADVTRTIPVGGIFSAEQRTIYQLVIRAQVAGLEEVRPGATIQDVHNAAKNVLKVGLKRLGLVTETSGNQYRTWFMHGTSHFIGLDVHDVGDRTVKFKPGMVLTVEPGVYVREDALIFLSDTPENRIFKEDIKLAFDRYKGIGVRIEDDVLVTEDGYELLSGDAPRTIDEIEAFMQ
ncbi:MAG: M24 family metallopeptidase [Candidatus Latescibacteria bacterium]|nr:M24 family metallopeptidase [Candidatus Latescibacterota bacterium]